MSNSVAQTWLEHKVANRPDVQSALLLLDQNGQLEQAAACLSQKNLMLG